MHTHNCFNGHFWVNWCPLWWLQQTSSCFSIYFSLAFSLIFLFVPRGGLSWLHISFLLHVKYTILVSYHIVDFVISQITQWCRIYAEGNVHNTQHHNHHHYHYCGKGTHKLSQSRYSLKAEADKRFKLWIFIALQRPMRTRYFLNGCQQSLHIWQTISDIKTFILTQLCHAQQQQWTRICQLRWCKDT